MATVLEAIQIGLRRTGMDETNSTFQDNARDYLNMACKELMGNTWWWAYKTSTFTTTASTRTYTLSDTDIDTFDFFVNETTEDPLEIVPARPAVWADIDKSTTGNPQRVYLEGIDTSTGAPVVALEPIPSTSSQTIRYRYYKFIPDFTSGDDATDLKIHIPPTLQPYLFFAIARLYKQEKGDDEGSAVEQAEATRILRRALRSNLGVEGDRTYRRQRSDEVAVRNVYQPAEGSLT